MKYLFLALLAFSQVSFASTVSARGEASGMCRDNFCVRDLERRAERDCERDADRRCRAKGERPPAFVNCHTRCSGNSLGAFVHVRCEARRIVSCRR